MAASLLAHSQMFAAGVGISGSYNRTLSPFGFQRERRTLWQDRDLYIAMSPLFHANQIQAPLLLVHGCSDNNASTPAMQSEMMFHAVRGNGGICRLVLLPGEGHEITARESAYHLLWEMLTWFDRFLQA